MYRHATWKWCFFHMGHSVHSCFVPVGTGAFVSRRTVNHFLRIQAKLKFDVTATRNADLYFSTLINQMPYAIEGKLIELGGSKEEPTALELIDKDHMWKGAQVLHQQMKYRTEGSFSPLLDPIERQPTSGMRDIRAACAGDDCLLLSNLDAIPQPNIHVLYRPEVDIGALELSYDAAFHTNFYTKHPYHHAVDGDPNSYFISQKRMSYFFCVPSDVRSIFYILMDLIHHHTQPYQLEVI
jgi:hypothetical protein